jgi:hypothetical protein
MKGYKAFNNDLTCRRFQYEIGKEYVHEGEIEPCKSGFHFCKCIADCYKFYLPEDSTRICEIEATGNIKGDKSGFKFCTDRIKIIREITSDERRANTSTTNSGYCNSGRFNSGYRNSGCFNSGDNNSGSSNTGSFNTGYFNPGKRNTGDYNSGTFNTGSHNMGNCNTGSYNAGYSNTGNYNDGNGNVGNYNLGDRNVGSWNIGNGNVGIFCTETPKLKIFDHESNWSLSDWNSSFVKCFMSTCPCSRTEMIPEGCMTDEEKNEHPEYEITGGYLKIIDVTDEDRQKWWDAQPEKNRERVINELPNFDAEKFYKCTGIRV